jgi:DNA polymerase-3 subunit gamma/tau
MVFYRKYRPQSISQLDLESVRNRLTSILSAKELPHAFLFTGPKGLGKTSSARILAKAINCEKRANRQSTGSSAKKETLNAKPSNLNPSIEPCNKCDACISITNGSNLDVLEIDAASNRGIDEIRDLREKIKYAPANLKTKVYIIDEVHMLTQDAFNALLKTLEEPPPHAVFILCTTEDEKVPPTIASRTFHVRFHLPSVEEIRHSLERIIDGEDIEIEKESEDAIFSGIFSLSEGSFRDAAKILEDMALSSKGKLSMELFEKTYKLGSINSKLQELLNAMSRKDTKVSLEVINDIANTGADFKVVTERIAILLHDILMGNKPPGAKIELEETEIKQLLKMVNDSYRDIKYSVLPQIPLELVVVEWCVGEQDQKSKLPDFAERREAGKSQIEEIKIESTDSGKSINESLSPPEKEAVPSQTNNEEQKKKHDDMFSENAVSTNFFISLISLVKQDNHSIAGILRGCKLISIHDGKVHFETKYKFHKDRLNEAKVRSILDKRASELLKENVQVVVNLVGQ